nr:MAG TPA: hypothetical protein [Caudoviricetes sp.]
MVCLNAPQQPSFCPPQEYSYSIYKYCYVGTLIPFPMHRQICRLPSMRF